jgi:L-alanine-DL-glutamate epimerase-like enolase superfamily enzyme
MKVSSSFSFLPYYLKFATGSYKWSGGKSVSVFDATVVRIDTNAGIYGVGENTPLGPFYLPGMTTLGRLRFVLTFLNPISVR